jgi:hypothetical protein
MERVVERRGTRHAVVQKVNELVAKTVKRLDARTA